MLTQSVGIANSRSLSRRSKSMKKLTIHALVLSSFIQTLGFMDLSLGAPTPSEKPKPKVTINKVIESEVSEDMIYPTQVTSVIDATLTADTEGTLSQVLVPIGKTVKKGEALAQIINPDPVYHYAPMTVRSPLDAVVNEVFVSIGSQISKGQKILSLTDPGKLRVVLEIPAADLTHFKLGKQGTFTSTSVPGDFIVEVTALSPTVDPSTGTARAELSLKSNSEQNPLRQGVLGKAKFKTELKKGITLPKHAVIYLGDKTYLRKIDGQKSVRIEVKLGRMFDDQVEVLSGVTPGLVYVERASRFVIDGESVEIENPI